MGGSRKLSSALPLLSKAPACGTAEDFIRHVMNLNNICYCIETELTQLLDFISASGHEMDVSVEVPYQ